MKPTGIRCDGNVERGGDVAVHLYTPLLQKFRHDLSRSGGLCHDQFRRGPIFLGQMVIDEVPAEGAVRSGAAKALLQMVGRAVRELTGRVDDVRDK